MAMTLPPGEPAAGPWRPVTIPALAELVRAAAGRPSGRPAIVAVDGRGASGKSTVAARLQEHLAASALVHTDDLAWHEPLFGWSHLLADGVLTPLHEGRALSYRPPQWEARDREGTVEVPARTGMVIVEGTGSSQRSFAHLVDATVWIQADFVEAERRGIARDVASGVNGGSEEATEFWHAWTREEIAFLGRHRPWERACVIVNGTPMASLDESHVEVATGPMRTSEQGCATESTTRRRRH